MSAPTGDRVVGRLLDGRYEVQSRVARGGMATVYRALDTRLDRTVAVKVMHPHLAEDADFAARFVHEARAAARLSHPGIVAVHDQGTDDDIVFLAMEYVPGRTLRDVVADEAPLPPLRAVLLVEQVLDALAVAHDAKIVHRDVKPENVLIGTGGGVKVADFGLARAITTDTTATATGGGLLIGTVSYLAPELVIGESATGRSDVYAVGVLLHELLTGVKPHQGETPIQVAYRHVNADVPAPSSHAHELDWPVPDFVDALVARATSRDPALRAPDAGVLLRQLRRVRSALQQGVHSDPELAADLLPRSPAPGHEDTVPDPVLEPAPPGTTRPLEPADDHEHTLVVGVVGSAGAGAAGQLPDTARPRARCPATATRKRRRGLVWLVVVLVLALLAGLGGWWYGVGRFTTTPRLLGLSEAEARAAASDAGLDVRIADTAFSEQVPSGSVVRTEPAPDERILDDGTISLVLSQGRERYPVPDLAGMDLPEAERTLEDTELVLGDTTRRWSERVDEGDVVVTAQQVGRTVRPGTAVDVVVSRGPQPVAVVDVRGRPLDEARAALEEAGFEVSVVPGRVYDAEVPAGAVAGQDPVGGTGFRGDEVELTVSRGPELVEMPDLTGDDAAAALAELADLDLAGSTQESAFYIGLDVVARQSEAPGEQLPVGTPVVLYLI